MMFLPAWQRGPLKAFAIAAAVQLLPFAAHCEETPVDPWSTSFHGQVKRSNDVYVEKNIMGHMQALHAVEQDVAAKSSLPLSRRLDLGGEREPEVVKEVQGLIKFQKRHNSRLDSWATDDAAFGSFLAPFRMSPSQVKALKSERFPAPWPYVAAHWYPVAMRLKLADHEIPKDGLDLQPLVWERSDDLAKKYAFFSLMRKACKGRDYDEGFLDSQTGYQSYWEFASQPVSLKRWRYPGYYVYNFIPSPSVPAASKGSLTSFMVSSCVWSRGSKGLKDFYNDKTALFSELVMEMGREDSLKKNAEPYKRFYSFVSSSFPCISAFQARQDNLSGSSVEFVDGFSGDKPARGIFDERSIMGMANKLYEQLAEKVRDPALCASLAREIFSPILLLQFSVDESSAEVSKGNFPYVDIKVGFSGYLDFYRRYTPSGSSARANFETSKGAHP